MIRVSLPSSMNLASLVKYYSIKVYINYVLLCGLF